MAGGGSTAAAGAAVSSAGVSAGRGVNADEADEGAGSAMGIFVPRSARKRCKAARP